MTELFSVDDTLDLDFYTVISDDNIYGRAVYLLDKFDLKLPNWLNSKFPFADELRKPKSHWSPLLQAMYKKGKVFGEGNLDELRMSLDKMINPELKDYDERKKFWNWLNGSLASGLFDSNMEIAMSAITVGQEIPKFNSGFKPFDNAIGGFYQAIVTVAGNPGSGKTSLILAFMNEVAKSYPVWYFQTEIPSQLIQARLSQYNTSHWHKDSMLFCGNYSSKSILEKVKAKPDANRVIIYDSPEIKNSSLDDLVYWEQTYQDFVATKQLSKLVVTTSQLKQNIEWNDLGVYSLSGSASKGRFTDITLYVDRFGDMVRVKTGKNRFGALGQSVVKFDYAKLIIIQDEISELFD